MSLPLSTTFDAANEPFEHEHHPVVPEPAGFGFAMVGFALLLIVYARYVRPRNRCCGGKCGRHS